MSKLVTLIILATVFCGCQLKYPGVPKTYHTLLDSALVKAGENEAELQKALAETPKEQKEGMAFIISYMPERDLTTLKADFLLENSEYAYKAREKYAWCAALPDSFFFNEVLPYANISENRDNWRKDFYERFAKYAEGEDDMVSALMSVAKNIKDEVNVEYNTKRSRVDIGTSTNAVLQSLMAPFHKPGSSMAFSDFPLNDFCVIKPVSGSLYLVRSNFSPL